MNVRPAGREACSCASPYNSILERLTAMEAQILTAIQQANTAVGIANTALSQVQATGIRTINQIQPDTDGDFSISAGSGIQINAGTNGIEIENTSQGAIYTGVSPISVNVDNEISLADWVRDSTPSGWGQYQTDNILNTDIVLVLEDPECTFYLPKGISTNSRLNISKTFQSETRYVFQMLNALISSFIRNGGYNDGNAGFIFEMSKSGTGISEVFTFTMDASHGGINLYNTRIRLYHR